MQRSSNAVLVLVLGILSFAPGFGPITGIPAWVIGNQSLRDMRDGIANPNEHGLVQAGRILGMIATLLFGFAFFLFVAWFLVVALVVGSSVARGR